MTTVRTDFWDAFDTAQRHAFAGEIAPAFDSIARARSMVEAEGGPFQSQRQELLANLAQFLTTGRSEPGADPLVETGYLGEIESGGLDGISLVTCAMNRTENLINALRSWIACEEISEIVIVDWSSDEPVAAALMVAGLSDPRIRVIRVEDEPRWILSYAFNVGFRMARFNRILKADADIVLVPDFFARNPMPPGAFIAGNWRHAKEGQSYVNGFFFVHRAQLNAVAGFNEYITTYGWDDDDLYERLEAVNAHRIDVDPDTIYHQHHSDAERTGEVEKAIVDAFTEITGDTLYRIRRNRFLANTMPVWNARRTHVPYTCYSALNGQTILKRSGHLPHVVPDHIEADADYYALMELASWRLGEDIIQLDRDALRGLLAQPFESLGPEVVRAACASHKEPALPAPSVSVPQSKLFIDAQHGLGNRMRAIGSAAAIAEATQRELIIVWEPDHHCEGRMTDLFDYNGAVIEENFVKDASRNGCQIYNYMEVEDGSEKDALINLDWSGDIYARAAYVLNAPASTWESENRFLRSLRPVEAVRDMVASVRTPNDVSAHVRMVGAPGSDTASYDRAENWTAEGHAAINHWREKSHYSNFMRRIDTLIAEGAVENIFLAADAPETYDAFLCTYGDRIAYLERNLYDRSAEQLRYALADALLLGSAPKLLGSNWSSFTELAMRLSGGKSDLEMSGKDF